MMLSFTKPLRDVAWRGHAPEIPIGPTREQKLRDVSIRVVAKRKLRRDRGEHRVCAACHTRPARTRRRAFPPFATSVPHGRAFDVVGTRHTLCLVQTTPRKIGWGATVAAVGVKHAVEVGPRESTRRANALQGESRRERPVAVELPHCGRVGFNATPLTDKSTHFGRAVDISNLVASMQF